LRQFRLPARLGRGSSQPRGGVEWCCVSTRIKLKSTRCRARRSANPDTLNPSCIRDYNVARTVPTNETTPSLDRVEFHYRHRIPHPSCNILRTLIKQELHYSTLHRSLLSKSDHGHQVPLFASKRRYKDGLLSVGSDARGAASWHVRALVGLK
jgi:hypothetical protein